MDDFYNQLSPFYHLIYPDWDASVELQGRQLSEFISSRVEGEATSILDVACGIGTQSLGLAALGYAVTASDLSPGAVDRGRREAALRGLDIAFSVCDMRQIGSHHRSGFDVVLCADNSMPHLLSDDAILEALRAMHSRLRDGGYCIVTQRDYAKEPRGQGIVKPYGVRESGDTRYLIWQVWDFEGDHYTVSMYFVEDDMTGTSARTRVMRSRYYAITTDTMLRLMSEAGFQAVERLDNVYFQPVLIGVKAR
ncbi:class I SAM-dependent methyltransferase [Pseudomaricurvus sp. HS19]|uniref:class I SAM-dependent methyltransferase n=1 Tax=Pseudomaricurvus sp. HS19 TaxID=2692626 RepID=UPI00136F3B64|nr:class I SAM-dependent methyltransferase [Pseudomaricurvus sp. HS19]MYM61799.1 methyltransferase domain-containing protein [Pseudomaricurvus sp. HS19]